MEAPQKGTVLEKMPLGLIRNHAQQSDESFPSSVHFVMEPVALSEDVLYIVFFLHQAMHTTVGGLLPHVVLSHVSRQWRALALYTPALWSNILITRKTNVAALQAYLERSGFRDLDVSIRYPPTRSRFVPRNTRDAIVLVGSQSHRWENFSFSADAAVLTNAMSLILRLSLPRLQSFEMVQTNPKSVVHFGPFNFNPDALATLRLRAVTIHPFDPAQFSGLRTLDIEAISCQCMIDQTCMDNKCSVKPMQPGHPAHITRLCKLSVRAILLQFPIHPSFDPSTIVSLALSGIRGSSAASIPDLIHLFNKLSSPNLRDLALDDVLGFAWEAFLQSLPSARYHGLKNLTLRSLSLGNLNMDFGHAFPEIVHLTILAVDPQPLRILIGNNPSLWPNVLFSID